MKIGVVSDTHDYFDPRLEELLRGVDVILHGGDVGSGDVLDRLAHLAKVRAVRGNVDSASLDLPPSLVLTLEGVQIEMQHELPVPQAELTKWADTALLGAMHPKRREKFLKAFRDRTRVVIFGHSHQPCLLTVGHKLFFNPGSAGRQRFSLPRSCGRLEIFPRGLRAEIMALGSYNGALPANVWLPVGE